MPCAERGTRRRGSAGCALGPPDTPVGCRPPPGRAGTPHTACGRRAARVARAVAFRRVSDTPTRMKAEQEALLEAVFADPRDDAPRLAYADWLAHHGEPLYAEFIHLQVQ